MVLTSWYLRDISVGENDPELNYDGKPTFFTMKINHGGIITKRPGRSYVNGKVNYVDMIDSDEFSVHGLHAMMKEIGYNNKDSIFFNFKKPNVGLDYGLEALGNDQDVINMLKYIEPRTRSIEVYTEHKLPNRITYFKSPQRSNVVIGETEVEQHGEIARKVRKKKVANKVKKKLVVDEPVNVDMGKSSVNEQHDVDMGPTSDMDMGLGGLGQTSNMGHNSGLGQSSDMSQTNNEVKGNENDSEDYDDEETDDESEDGDFIVDEENLVETVEVDMRNFKLNIDMDVEWVGMKESNVEVSENIENSKDALSLEDFESGSDNEEDGPRKRAMKKLRQKNQVTGGVINLHVGREFGDKKEIKELITRLSVETRRDLHIVKNDTYRVRVVCRGNIPIFTNLNSEGPSDRATSSNPSKYQMTSGKKCNIVGVDGIEDTVTHLTCSWVLHISKCKKDETWTVKTFEDVHRCMQTRLVKKCTSSFLSKDVEDTIGPNPKIPVKALQYQLQKKYEVGVSLMKAYRAKNKATEKLRGDYMTQYNLIRDYICELQSTNPNTTVKIDVEETINQDSPTRQFRRIYICLGSLKKGFKGLMRELLGLDGCFMKGPFPGQILTAVGIDANNQIYPVAYGVVEAETTKSWTWFLECLGDDLDLVVNSNFTFITDRQKGLIPAMAKVFPAAEHRYCLRHIHDNMKGTWRGKLYKDQLWKCATATTVPHFNKCMLEMKSLNADIHDWLTKIPPMHWARSHFSGRAKCDVLLNNMCEVFNRQLLDARDKPIITCLEYIREYLMRRLVVVQKEIDKCDGPLTPHATTMFEAIKKEATKYTAVFGGHKYQVTGPYLDQCVVDIEKKECTCRKWELTGMPCKHAVATIWNMALNAEPVGLLESWVHPSYWLATWKDVYANKIDPISGRTMWPKSLCPTTLIAPIHHTQIGRPKKKRKKSFGEMGEGIVENGKLSRGGKSVTCGKCKNIGHNARSCKGQGGNQGSGAQGVAGYSEGVGVAGGSEVGGSQAGTSKKRKGKSKVI